jgi:hypothetical protein
MDAQRTGSADRGQEPWARPLAPALHRGRSFGKFPASHNAAANGTTVREKDAVMRIATAAAWCLMLAALPPGGVHAQDRVRARAGDTVRCSITARDSHGNVVRSWDQVGSPLTLTLRNSAANTDTSMHSWNADPRAYSFATLSSAGAALTAIAANDWVLPPSAFSDGVAAVEIVHTRADTGVVLAVTSSVPFRGDVAAPMDFVSGPLDNFLVDLTPATAAGNQVYNARRYEILVTPRDHWLNILDTAVYVRLFARFPGEFTPGGGWYPGTIPVRGVSSILLTSDSTRIAPSDLQVLGVHHAFDARVRGETAPYEVLDHPPHAFRLLTPRDKTEIRIGRPTARELFTWERPVPPDPYTDIRVGRSSPLLLSDTVRYTVYFGNVDAPYTTIAMVSDSAGSLPHLSLSHLLLDSLPVRLTGNPNAHYVEARWYVEASDGIYRTHNMPPHEERADNLILITRYVPMHTESAAPFLLSLSQNYPNPFNPSTTVDFTTTRRGYVRLRVFDIRGVEVALLADGEVNPGPHQAHFDAAGLPPGIYSCRLEAEGATLSKWMVLLK